MGWNPVIKKQSINNLYGNRSYEENQAVWYERDWVKGKSHRRWHLGWALHDRANEPCQDLLASVLWQKAQARKGIICSKNTEAGVAGWDVWLGNVCNGLRGGKLHTEQDLAGFSEGYSTHRGKMVVGSGQGLLKSSVSLGSFPHLWAALTSGSKWKGKMFTERVGQPAWKLTGRLCLVKRPTKLFSGQAWQG